jgi:hypothetical protein
LSIFDLEEVARKRAFSKSQIGIRQSEIDNEATRRGYRIRSVALPMHDLKRISDIAQVEPLDRDNKNDVGLTCHGFPFGRVNDAARLVIFEVCPQIVR